MEKFKHKTRIQMSDIQILDGLPSTLYDLFPPFPIYTKTLFKIESTVTSFMNYAEYSHQLFAWIFLTENSFVN